MYIATIDTNSLFSLVDKDGAYSFRIRSREDELYKVYSSENTHMGSQTEIYKTSRQRAINIGWYLGVISTMIGYGLNLSEDEKKILAVPEFEKSEDARKNLIAAFKKVNLDVSNIVKHKEID